MSKGFRVTVEDLDLGQEHSVIAQSGDYVLIPFAPCHLTHTQRSINGTVQITLRDHKPGAQPGGKPPGGELDA